MKSQEQKKIPLVKRILYGSILSVASVVLFLGAFEILLRATGFGFNTSYYRIETDTSGVKWYRENRDFTATFFSKELIRRPPVMKIPLVKGGNTYRIFVLGGSAAMGDPEASYSVARVLRVMLQDAYPEVDFEIINSAVTAINSSVVKYIAQDCSKLDPDLFIVYVGNNEVIGPFGPASVFTPFMSSPAWVNFTVGVRKSRIGQLLTNSLKGANESDSWGGMQMFLDQAITANNPKMKRVYDLYQSNLEDIVDTAMSKGTEVLLCSVPTNIRDFSPFLSEKSSRLTGQQVDAYEDLIALGDEALASMKKEDALKYYMDAESIYPESADINYRVGRVLLGLKKPKEAKAFMEKARDFDTLRFRADSKLNEVVQNVSKMDNCSFVDLMNVAESHSLYGIPGNEFFYEHVHLTMFGNYQIASQLFNQIGDALLSEGKIVQKVSSSDDYPYVCKRLAYTPYDQALITFELVHRFTNEPFISQIDGGQRLNEWEVKSQKITQILTIPACQKSVRNMYEEAIEQDSSDWVLKRNYGMYLVAQNEPQIALKYLISAYNWVSDDPDTLYALATANGALGRPGKAEAYLGILKAIEPGYPGLDTL